MTAHRLNALAQTTAHLLASARHMAAGNALLFVSAICLGGHWAAVQVLLFVVLLYLHIRMDFDRRLFLEFAILASCHLRPEDFDACRVALGLGQPANGAEMQQRCAGAVKLLKRAAFCTALQCLLLLVQILVSVASPYGK